MVWNGPRSAPGTSAQPWSDTDNLYAVIAAYTLRFPFFQMLPSMESENAQKSTAVDYLAQGQRFAARQWRYLDLDGDGIADAIVPDKSVTVRYRSLDECSFSPPSSISAIINEERGSRQLFTSSEESIFFSDLSGDDLVDVV
jgi:hypothetical protein